MSDIDPELAHATATILERVAGAEAAVLADLVSALARSGVGPLAQELGRRAEHAEPEVRVAVAQALGQLRDASPATVAALVILSRDPEVEVRSWATFALAGEHLDGTAGVHDALAARIRGDADDVRLEAIR